MINIVLLTDCLADLTGGAERQIFELAKRLDRGKYKVIITSLETEGQAPRDTIESMGCRLETFKVKRIYDFSGFKEGLRFRQFLKQEQVDILLTYHFSSDIWGTFWGHLAGLKTIISNRRDMGFWRNNRHLKAYQFINRWVDKVVVVCEAVKNMIMKVEGVPEGKIEIIYNGVEQIHIQTSADSVKKELGFDSKDIIIMHVANLKPIKGHSYLLQAFAQAVDEFPDLKLVLIGEDELNGALQRQAQEFKIDKKILFLGKRKDVRELLIVADICVLSSLSEGMSNAILEYMAAGKPVIATRVGGNSELIVDHYNGILVQKENRDALKQAMAELISDPQKRLAMGHNGLQRIKEKFSMEAMGANYEKLFKDLIS